MSQELWNKVDRYLVEKLVSDDHAEVLKSNAEAGLPAYDVAANQGKLLHLLARIQGAKHILEIGTLGGYSTIWLARALPADGKLVTLESDPKHAEVARSNISRAGLSGAVDLRVGPALTLLTALKAEAAIFDFIFIDADKPNNPGYLEAALSLSRVGTVIVCDNVVREGKVADARSSDPSVQGTRRFFDMVASNPRLSATAIQTVGSKGHDGFVLAVVVSVLTRQSDS